MFHPSLQVVGTAIGVLTVLLGYWLVQNRRRVIASRQAEGIARGAPGVS